MNLFLLSDAELGEYLGYDILGDTSAVSLGKFGESRLAKGAYRVNGIAVFHGSVSRRQILLSPYQRRLVARRPDNGVTVKID